MSNFPDFSKLGYQVERELGQNRASGRVTYLATNTDTQLPVVVKQFQFAQSGVSWSDYDAYQREIQVLQQLNHPNIPRYLNSFETPYSGFCLVQEYKKAPSLAQPRHWTPEEIKQIAVAVLKVLMYLQKQVPPVIHRDIKPENILVNRQGELKVTLVDFGFAHMGAGEVAVSSVVKGTLGFMPPEQLFNRQLTEASDLYSLGATLICLLTQTKSTQIGNLIDETYRINFKHLVPHLNPQFIGWLEKMVAPSLKKRYPNAAAALKALQPINVVGTTTPAILARVTKLRTRTAAVGLATLGFLPLLGTSCLIYTKIAGDPVRQLLETNQCPRCDLTSANLASAGLTAANLKGANLKRAFLGRAFLGSSNLKNANLKGANLESALLGLANLESANLGNANLESAYLGSAYLRGASLGNANLESAYLKGADLTGANLKGADLTGAKLGGADLTGADLTAANLKGADFTGAIMPDRSIHP